MKPECRSAREDSPENTLERCPVIIVDEHELVRHGLAVVLAGTPNFYVLMSTGLPLPTTLDLAGDRRAILIFDCAQIDAASSRTALRELRERQSHLEFLAFASLDHDRYIEEALGVGARAYVSKTSPIAHVLAALGALVEGGTYFDEPIAERLLASPDALPPTGELAWTKRSLLSRREKEILGLVSLGMRAHAIAKSLHISTKTVDRHKANMMEKLGIHSQVQLARYALAEGLVHVETDGSCEISSGRAKTKDESLRFAHQNHNFSSGWLV